MGTNSAAVAAGDTVGARETGAFLNGACISDPSLRQQVESLHAASDEVRSSFLESPLAVGLARGTRLGEYEVQSLLGAGAMDEVYREGSAPAALRAGGRGGCGSESPEYSGRLRWARMKAAARPRLAVSKKGIMHRDLKPDNLFVTKHARIKIRDGIFR